MYLYIYIPFSVIWTLCICTFCVCVVVTLAFSGAFLVIKKKIAQYLIWTVSLYAICYSCSFEMFSKVEKNEVTLHSNSIYLN